MCMHVGNWHFASFYGIEEVLHMAGGLSAVDLDDLFFECFFVGNRHIFDGFSSQIMAIDEYTSFASFEENAVFQNGCLRFYFRSDR